MTMTTQPQYPDRTTAWCVQAVCTGGGLPSVIATTYVRARDEEHAADLGRAALRLRSTLRGRRGWTAIARPADPVRDLGMSTTDEQKRGER